MRSPWDHPDWYDVHDMGHTAGNEREPEHYREFVISLPPLDRDDHLIDVGAGTGKLAALIAASYPRLGRVTLIDPNAAKLERARERLALALPAAELAVIPAGLGDGARLPESEASLVSIGSVFMPVLLGRGGSLEQGLEWLRRALVECAGMLRPGGWLAAIETLSPPWLEGAATDPARRLTMLELREELVRAGLDDVECTYRFRDRVTFRGRRRP